MCFGGGNSATQQAAAQAAAQQSAISNNVNQINSAFANRNQQYSDYLNALNTSYQTQLNLQQSQAARGLKFALARGGMTGSSVAADQGAELQREAGQGTIQAQEQANAKLAALQSSDEAERLQMISLAQSGANIGNAAQQTATALNSNLSNAQSALGPTTLGNAFGGITQDITNANIGAQTRLGLMGSYGAAFSPSGIVGGGTKGI